MRTYGEYCSIARSLDVIGDRWTLLIVRELSAQGPSRYTDIRRGLPGIATNLLGDRLRELEAAGVVVREEAPPPVATTLFRLTPRGEDLRPVLDHLRQWGLPLMTEVGPDDVVRSDWLTGTLAILLADMAFTGAPATVELRVGDAPITVRLSGDLNTVEVGAAPNPDLILTGPPPPVLGTLLGLVSGEASAAIAEGDVTILERLAPVQGVTLEDLPQRGSPPNDAERQRA